MRVNTTKAKLNEGKVVFGGIISGFAPEIVEVLALCGYDFVFLDCEHGPMSFDQVEQMVRAAEAAGITPIARIPDQQDATLLRYLDRGVQGVIVPHVNTKEQAERIAGAARYFPDGHRGAASGRAHDYNVTVSREESMQFINDNVLVIPMCEEVEAVKNLEAILTLPGIDIVHCASSDLRQSMGNPPLAEVREVMHDVVQRVRAGGKHAGIGGNSPGDTAGVGRLIEAGANFVTISALSLLRVGAEQFRDASIRAGGRSV
ncbi:MAG: HpcH/HpaI aldolase/citrate lyase family protein [Dehalococcoidia bacterium]